MRESITECKWIASDENIVKLVSLARKTAFQEAAAIVEDEAMPSEQARFGVAADRIRDRIHD